VPVVVERISRASAVSAGMLKGGHADGGWSMTALVAASLRVDAPVICGRSWLASRDHPCISFSSIWREDGYRVAVFDSRMGVPLCLDDPTSHDEGK
jgi:hypothetical protein